MSRFTDGPWRVRKQGKRRIRYHVEAPERLGNGEVWYPTSIARDIDRPDDAKVIAAAPELYYALYALVHNTMPFQAALKMGRDALEQVDG